MGPWLENPSHHPFYGRLEIDLDAVGAPMWPDEDVPAPDAADPIEPGVLVEEVDWFPGYPAATPVLLVGTNNQTRNPVISYTEDGGAIVIVSTDGAGIGLIVHRATESQILGRWREWGIVVGGRGVFCARRLAVPATDSPTRQPDRP